MEPILITKEHFDRACAQQWSTNTCILQQATNGSMYDNGRKSFDFSPEARKIMSTFDSNFTNPGDEKCAELQTLRDSLPITV
mgnify:CR=1 FL=1